MKKIFINLFGFLIGCSSGSSSDNSMLLLLSILNSQNSSTPIAPHRILKGQAAIGSFLPVGSIVQIRPAAVNGVPSDIIETTISDMQGNYSVEISSLPNSSVKIKTGGSTAPAISGFIIRVNSSGSWLYSYADNSGDTITSNVNPYTDIMIRQFYQTIDRLVYTNTADYNVENLFPTGFCADGVTVMPIPDPMVITEISNSMSAIIARVYNLPSISDFINTQWEEGAPLDALLGSAYFPHMVWFLNTEFLYLYYWPDAITDGAAIQIGPVGSPVQIDIWTPYGNTGSVTLGALSDKNGNTNPETVMIKMSDSVSGSNHFQTTTINLQQVGEQSVQIKIDDYQLGTWIEMAIQTE